MLQKVTILTHPNMISNMICMAPEEWKTWSEAYWQVSDQGRDAASHLPCSANWSWANIQSNGPSQCCQLVHITLQLLWLLECSIARFTFWVGKKISQQFNTRGVPPAASKVSRCRGLQVGWSTSSQASTALWKPLEQRHPAPAHQPITPSSCLLLPANGNGLHFLPQ